MEMAALVFGLQKSDRLHLAESTAGLGVVL
jgi:hypothetical protein